MLGGLKGQDFVKLIIIIVIVVGAVLIALGFGDTFVGWFDSV